MKKTFITMCAVLIASVSMAAGHVDSVRYLTTKAGRNWFISANGSMNWWQNSDKNPIGDYDKVQWEKTAFGGSFSVGKWLNHKAGVRISYDVNGFNSYINKAYDPENPKMKNYLFLYKDNPTPDANGYYETHGMYHNLHGDFLFSPIDFFQGYYNPERLWTPVIYAGMGVACVSEYFFALKSIINDEGRNFEYSTQVGLLNRFRINEYLDLNLDLNWSTQEWHIDSWYNECQDPRPRRADFNYSVDLGLTYYIRGRIYELPTNYEREMKEMRERIKNLENELEAVPAPVPVPVPADTVVIYQDNIEAISYPFSIFFNLDSYQLMSKRDLVNLKEIANVAKANGYKLRLRGSCDSATATAEYNQRLSENRCRKIQQELLDMGFPEENIILEPVGGVKELDPTEFDRRVLIDLIKYHE